MIAVVCFEDVERLMQWLMLMYIKKTWNCVGQGLSGAACGRPEHRLAEETERKVLASIET